MTSLYHFPRYIIFHLVDDLGVEEWQISCHHDGFREVLEQAIEGLERDFAPRKFRLSRIELDD